MLRKIHKTITKDIRKIIVLICTNNIQRFSQMLFKNILSKNLSELTPLRGKSNKDNENYTEIGALSFMRLFRNERWGNGNEEIKKYGTL